MNILNDIDHEYIWLEFKNVIYNVIITDELKKEIDLCSELLNNLKKNNRYNDIHEIIKNFLNNNINEIILSIIIYGNANTICHFYNRVLKRWKHIEEIYNNESVFNKSFYFEIFQSLAKYVNNFDERYNIISRDIKYYFELCKLFNLNSIGCLQEREVFHINSQIKQIIICALKNRCTTVINCIYKYHIYDMTFFYKNEYKNNKYKVIYGNKIYKYIDKLYL